MSIVNNKVACIRCAKDECFACINKRCDFLLEKSLNKKAECKFFKTKEQYNNELRYCAKRLNYSIDEYLKLTGLKFR